ncbi:SPOR domain-containing protein [Zooshikella sp. RANM57]|uniref:SPOR domain-containing protein n=1 Tax=Zooshikella sp. RANM57 TaxID=3425863 RepID=UPI003D700D0D
MLLTKTCQILLGCTVFLAGGSLWAEATLPPYRVFSNEQEALTEVEKVRTQGVRGHITTQRMKRVQTQLFIGPYYNKRSARRHAEKLQQQGMPAIVTFDFSSSQFLIRVGVYSDQQRLDAYTSQLHRLGYSNQVQQQKSYFQTLYVVTLHRPQTKLSTPVIADASKSPPIDEVILTPAGMSDDISEVATQPISEERTQVTSLQEEETEIDVSPEVSDVEEVGEEQIIIVEQASESALTADYSGEDEIVIESDEALTVNSDGDTSELIIVNEDSQEIIVSDEFDATDEGVIDVADSDMDIVLDQDTLADLEIEAPSAFDPSLKLEFSGGRLPRSKSLSDYYFYSLALASLQYQWSNQWEFKTGLRADASKQEDITRSDVTLDYGENYIRYRTDNYRFTLGSQIVLWGIADEVAPTDQVSVQDLTQGIVPRWQDRHRAYPMLRWEYFKGDSKWDLLWMPWFRPAELPDDEHIWAVMNKAKGTVFGFASDPIQQVLVQEGHIHREKSGSGGAGVRFSQKAEGFDYSLTAQRIRRSFPYYQLAEPVRQSLLLNPFDPYSAIAQNDDTWLEIHPYTWVVGGDIAFIYKDITWRFEGAYSSDRPATELDLRVNNYPSYDWVFSGEFYPGDGDDRLNLQLVGSYLDTDDKLIDRKRLYYLNGQYEGLYANNRWRWRMRFNHGLNLHDDFISSELAFLGWEPHEFYWAAYLFEGSPRSYGGYYKDNTLVNFGWRGEF